MKVIVDGIRHEEAEPLSLNKDGVRIIVDGVEQGGGPEPPEPVVEPLCFTAEQAGSTIKMEHYGKNAPSISLETSVDDGATWQPFTVDSTKITLSNVGDKVFFRACANGNDRISLNAGNENNFIMTGKISASGSIHSLLNANKTPDVIPSYCYAELFYSCNSLTSVVVPDAHTFEHTCYYYLLHMCKGLLSVTCLFKSWTDATGDINTKMWLAGANTSYAGTFYCPAELGTQETIQRDNSNNCPYNWTVVNT